MIELSLRKSAGEDFLALVRVYFKLTLLAVVCVGSADTVQSHARVASFTSQNFSFRSQNFPLLDVSKGMRKEVLTP